MVVEAFRGSPRPTLGVELELQLIDARTLDLTPAADAVLAALPGPLRESVKPEFYPCCVEINTAICRDPGEAGRDLVPKLDAVAGAAARCGARLAWGGTHPFAHWRDQPITPDPRYLDLAEELRETLTRQLTFGLHVHVGVPDGDAAVRACGRVAEHIPALLALSANSPFWCGRATGLHAHRVEVMGASPIGGPPPSLGRWEEYVRLVDRLAAAGIIHSTKDLWWDARPSERHGTVEVRICDMPADLPSVLGLAALIQCLVAELEQDDGPCPALDDFGQLILRQNRWRAARYGLDAALVDPVSCRPMPARAVVLSLADRLAATAEALGCARELGYARVMAHGPSGAERQLAVFARARDLRAVARHQAGDPAPEDGRAAPNLLGRAPFVWPPIGGDPQPVATA